MAEKLGAEVGKVPELAQTMGAVVPRRYQRKEGRTMDAATIPNVQDIHRLKISVTEAVADGLDTARKIGKQTSDAAEELMDDTAERIRRHPAETVVFAFVIGFLIGGFASWMTRHR